MPVRRYVILAGWLKRPNTTTKTRDKISNNTGLVTNTALHAKVIEIKTKIPDITNLDSELSAYPLCLGNISKDFTIDHMKNLGLYGYVYDFSVDYDSIDVDDTLDINEYLMKKHYIK